MHKQLRGKLDSTLAAMFSNQEYSSNYLFYAHMIGQCSIKIDKEIPAPAGVSFITDHYNLYINPEEFDKFKLTERLAILKHEMLHILLGHVKRSENRVHLPWNLSTDTALNQLIDSTHIPECAILPSNLGKMINCTSTIPQNESAEFYYELIKDNTANDKDCEHCTGTGDEPDPEDSNEANNSSGVPSKKPCSVCSGTGTDSNPGSKGNSTKETKSSELMDSHGTWENSTGDSDLQKAVTKRMTEKAQTETIKSKGTIPSEYSEWLELHSTKSEMDWKKILRGIVGNKKIGKRSSIHRRDRRFPKREDLRGKIKTRTFNLLVISDVSGSMSNTAVLKTLQEVQHICDVTKTPVNLIQIDAQAYKPELLTKKTKIFDRKGSGGTELFGAVEMAKTHNLDYQAIVVLTDGYIFETDMEKFQSLKKKLIWLIEPNGKIMPEMNANRMKAFQLK